MHTRVLKRNQADLNSINSMVQHFECRKLEKRWTIPLRSNGTLFISMMALKWKQRPILSFCQLLWLCFCWQFPMVSLKVDEIHRTCPYEGNVGVRELLHIQKSCNVACVYHFVIARFWLSSPPVKWKNGPLWQQFLYRNAWYAESFLSSKRHLFVE
jgi:hypothetical protein